MTTARRRRSTQALPGAPCTVSAWCTVQSPGSRSKVTISRSLSFLKTSSAARFLAFHALPWTVCNMQTIVMIGVAFVREIDLSGVTLELTEVSANGIAHGGAGP